MSTPDIPFWTPALIERLVSLRRAGLSLSEIAAALGDGCNRSMVAGKLHRLGEFSGAGRGGRRGGFVIDDRQRDAVIGMFNAGASLVAIGDMLDVHKKTAGRIVRDIVGAEVFGAIIGSRSRRGSPETVAARARRRRAVAPGVVADRMARFFAAERAPETSVRLLDAHNHHCRWPFGEGVEFRFCGAPADVAAGKPYCDHHDALAHGRPFADPSSSEVRDGSADSAPQLAEAAE
jgi:GcrA cell cycle regulator